MDQPSVRKTYKYKLIPTAAQEWEVQRVLRLCRTLYNTALEQRSTAWERWHVSVSRSEQEAALTAIRGAFPEYAALHSHVLHDVLARRDRTDQAFFGRLKAGQPPGFPRVTGHDRLHSCTYKEYGNGARLDNACLVLSKMGRIAVRWSGPLEGTPKTVTLSKEPAGWYVALSCAEVPGRPQPLTGEATGIDLGLESFVTLADGAQIATPRLFRVAELALKRAQRRVARRNTGSHRRRKALVLLATAHQTVRRARADFEHQTALALVRASDTIAHEDLPTAHLLTNHHLAKRISDAGWSAFVAIRSCTAADAGKTVVAVPPAYTSHAGSGCGVLVSKGVSVRWHSCRACGTSLHRDQNAARNIVRLGHEQSRAGQARQALPWPVGASVA